MTTQTLNAAENPALANKIAQAVTNVQVEETVGSTVPTITIPSLPDTNIDLPGGFYDPMEDEMITTAEVRELTGADEEAIVKISEPGKALMTILEKATVSIGGKPADKETLNMLLAGDREALLLAIRRVTFGNEVELETVCDRCPELQTFVIDLTKDVKVKTLDDRINDRRFVLDLKVGKVKVALPTGDTQLKLVNASNKNTAELDTLLLSSCVLEINDVPVLGQAQIRNLGIKDRRTILEEIAKRNPGPLLSEVKKACSACGQEVELPLTLAELFRS